MKIINREFDDNSIIISPILFYIGIMSFSFSQNSLNILFFFLIPLSLIYCLLSTLYLLIKMKSTKSLVPKIIILLSPLLIFPIIKIADLFQNKILIEAENDEGKNLYLYSDNAFKFTAMSLLGTDIRKGTYKISNNEVILTYDNVEYYENKTINLKMKNNFIADMKIIKSNDKNSASH